MFLKSGRSTEGESDSVRFVGPREPITYRWRPNKEEHHSSLNHDKRSNAKGYTVYLPEAASTSRQAFLANLAAALFRRNT